MTFLCLLLLCPAAPAIEYGPAAEIQNSVMFLRVRLVVVHDDDRGKPGCQ